RELPRRARARANSRALRRARAPPTRPTPPRVSVGLDARHHVHVRPRAEPAPLPADWPPRATPPGHASPERSGEDGKVHRHSAVSLETVCGLSREAAEHA